MRHLVTASRTGNTDAVRLLEERARAAVPGHRILGFLATAPVAMAASPHSAVLTPAILAEGWALDSSGAEAVEAYAKSAMRRAAPAAEVDIPVKTAAVVAVSIDR